MEEMLADPRKQEWALKYDQFVVQPGDLWSQYIDRVEGAKHVGIVAGYYNLQPGKVNRDYIIETYEQRGGGKVKNKTIETKPIRLAIGLILGADGVLKSKARQIPHEPQGK
jgi:hypothetical protein